MKKILLAACAVLALTGVARGDGPIKEYATTGNWRIQSDSDSCYATTTYPSIHHSVTFAVTANGSSVVFINNQKWKIPKGEYEIMSAVDGGIPAKFTGLSEDSIVSWKFDLSENNINTLSKGSILHVYIGGVDYKYSLEGSSSMLVALIRCTATLAVSANPFAGQPSPSAAPVSTPDNPFRKT